MIFLYSRDTIILEVLQESRTCIAEALQVSRDDVTVRVDPETKVPRFDVATDRLREGLTPEEVQAVMSRVYAAQQVLLRHRLAGAKARRSPHGTAVRPPGAAQEAPTRLRP